MTVCTTVEHLGFKCTSSNVFIWTLPHWPQHALVNLIMSIIISFPLQKFGVLFWVFLLICNQSFAEFFACHLNIVPLTHLAVLFFTCHDAHWMIALSVSLCVCHDCCFVHVLVLFFISFTCSTTSQQCVIQRIKEKSTFLKRNTEDKRSRRSTFKLS